MDDSSDGGQGGCGSFLAAAMALVALAASVFFGIRDIQYRIHGRQTQAEVSYTYDKAVEDGPIPVSQYDFKVGGQTFWGKTTNLPLGQAVPIEYLEGDPASNRVLGTHFWMPGGLIAFVMAVGLGAAAWYMFKRDSDLLTD